MLTRRHLKTVDAVLDDEEMVVPPVGHDWAATVVRTKGISILVIGLYLTSG